MTTGFLANRLVSGYKAFLLVIVLPGGYVEKIYFQIFSYGYQLFSYGLKGGDVLWADEWKRGGIIFQKGKPKFIKAASMNR
jgi:hypothetical protein